jgi:pyruvate,water dikinase
MSAKYVVWFDQVDKEDGAIVGGKGANLGEMTQAGFPVPPGFIVAVAAYKEFLDHNRLEEKIRKELEGLDVSKSDELERTAKTVQHLITRSEFPKDIAQEIIKAYFALNDDMFKHPYVAVRSSATAEDLPNASFAGQQATFLNVSGESSLIEKVKEAWASLFTARAIFYRVTNKFDHFTVSIAVPVQKMVASEKSGIMFSVDPVTNDKTKIIIEAIYGLGELIVQGAVTPDHYEVNKKELKILIKQPRTQERMMTRKGSKNSEVNLSKSEGSKQKLTDKEIVELASLSKKLEHHYFFPQDSEWAIEDGKIYLVQTRPVTTLQGFSASSNQLSAESRKLQAILKGDPASPGMASGPVTKLTSPKELNKIKTGDVLVAEMTNPDYVPAMRKAVAIVTERGGRTSHAAIVSRELGIPCVVGAKGARKVLKDGLVVTVNGTNGEIYRGMVMSNIKLPMPHVIHKKNLKTATNVYVNLAEPDRAKIVAKMNVDGVGLFRAEFMMAQIGTHPRKFIDDKKESLFIHQLAAGMTTICEAFHPRPVVYRASDFRTNEFRGLAGGEKYEPKEENPMLGYRGAARYIADPRVFEMELEAIKIVRNKHGLKNLSLMIPFVRSAKELLEVKKIVIGAGLSRSSSFHFWMMVEIPTNVISIDKYLDIGIDGVSIGSNDLTMLILGTDRDNSEVAKDFHEMDEAVLWALERTIKACAKQGITSSICGQAPSDYPELVEKLVSWGVTSVSVNADVVDGVRQTIYEAERKLITK